MNRETVVRWCAVREKALDALKEVHRHLGDMATLSLSKEPVLLHLADAGQALARVESRLKAAKAIAVQDAA